MSKSRVQFILLMFVFLGLCARESQAAVPVITSGTSAEGDTGSLFTYQIVATDSPTLYEATWLPSGLTLNGYTGLISGTPTQTGTFNSTLSAINSSGTGSALLTLVVVPGATTVSWTGAVSTDWFDARNWDTQFVPRGIDHVAIASGTVAATSSAAFAGLTLAGGTLTGDLALKSGSMEWRGGTFQGSLSIAPGAALVLFSSYGGENSPTLTGTLENSGVITTDPNASTTSTLVLSAQGRIDNLQDGMVYLTNFHGLNVSGTPGSVFSNAGTLRCNMGSGAIRFNSVAFTNTNTGLVDLQNGYFSSDIGFTNFGSMTTAPFVGMSGGVVELSGTIAGNLTASYNTLYSNDVAGNFTLSGTLAWMGSKITGSMAIASGGALSVSPNTSNPPTLTGTLENSGVITTDPNASSASTLVLGAQGRIDNLQDGLVYLTNFHGLNVSGTTGSVFSNAGTLRCDMGSGAIRFTSVVFTNTNTGLVDLQSGYFSSDIGFANYGMMTTVPYSGMSGGVVELSGTIAGNLTASYNALYANDVAGDFTLSGTLAWMGSKITGNVTIASGGALSVSANTYNPPTLTGTLENSGTITTDPNVGSTPSLMLGAQGRIDNLQGGLVYLTNFHGLNVSGTTGSVFSNAGTLRCDMGSGAISFTRVGFTNTNTGLVDLQNGHFSSDIGFANFGSMTTAPVVGMGGGVVELSGTIAGNLTASYNALYANDVAGDFTLSGTLAWMGSKITGKVAIGSGGCLSVSANTYNPPTLTGTLENSGVITTDPNLSSTPSLVLGAQGRLDNLQNGLFLLTSSYGFNLNGTIGSAFSNAGILRCNMGSGSLNLTSIAFSNTGWVDMQKGSFYSELGFSNTGSMTTDASDSMGGGGRILLGGNISGSLTASDNELAFADVTGNFTLSGTLFWRGFSLRATVEVAPGGTVALCSSGGGNPPTLSGTLSNGGVFTTDPNAFSTPVMALEPQARFNNLTGGLFSPSSSCGMILGGSPGATFSNAGTLRCAMGNQILSLSGVAFNNTGAVDVQGGVLSFTSSFSQSAGSTSLSGTGVSLQSSQPLQISGGTLEGTGVIDGSVLNSGGSVKPGTTSSIGALTIQGAYTQSGSGLLALKISGTTPQTGFDSLAITGQASLGGSMKATFSNGFQPAADQSFALLTYGSLGSNTLAFDLPSLSGGLGYTKTFSDAQFTLGISAPRYSTWKKEKFGADTDNPAVSGDHVVHNPAGIDNLTAYALGLDPFTASSSDLPVSALESHDGSQYLSFTFRRDTTATDLTYSVEASSDLNDPNSWTLLAQSVNGAPTEGPGLMAETGSDSILSVEVRDTQSVNVAPRRFIRLKVTH